MLILIIRLSKISSDVKFTNMRAFVNQIKEFVSLFFLNKEGQLSNARRANT